MRSGSSKFISHSSSASLFSRLTHSVRFGEEGEGVGDGGADAEFGDDFGVVLDG